MVAFTGFSRPDTYIISTTGNTIRQVPSSTIAATSSSSKNPKMKTPTTTIMVKTVSVANNNSTKVPTTANVIKTTLASPIPRFLSPKQSVGSSTSSSSATTMTTSSLQQTYSSTLNSSSPSWTTLLSQQHQNAYSDSDDSSYDPSSSYTASNNSTNCGEPKKRRRLTHLTPEEKILRRKLKNRVAAQTARDRKKAQMNDMEDTIGSLQAENKKLMQYNATLQKKAYDLAAENAELRHRLGQFENGECSVSSSLGESAASVKTEPKSPRSAEPPVPQLKKQTLILSHLIMQFTCFLSLAIYSHFWMKFAAQKMLPVLSIKLHQFHQKQSAMKKQKKLLLVQCRVPTKWWGPHQQNWTPSMN